MKPSVTIILPTYNREKFIGEALDCIHHQTYQNYRLIVVDDGSTDNTQAIVASYQEVFSGKLQYIGQENQGAGAARKAAIQLVETRYVAFYDSDDLWTLDHLEVCVGALEKNTLIDCIFGSYEKINYNTKKIYAKSNFSSNFYKLKVKVFDGLNLITDEGLLSFAMRSSFPATFPCSVFRFEIFEKIKIPDFRIAEDVTFIIKCIAHGYKFAYYDKTHMYYRVHENQTSVTPSEYENTQKKIEHYQEHLRAFEALRKDFLDQPQALAELDQRIANDSFWILGYHYLWENNFKSQALQAMREGLKYQPYSLKMRKTYYFCRLKKILGL